MRDGATREMGIRWLRLGYLCEESDAEDDTRDTGHDTEDGTQSALLALGAAEHHAGASVRSVARTSSASGLAATRTRALRTTAVRASCIRSRARR